MFKNINYKTVLDISYNINIEMIEDYYQILEINRDCT